MTNDPEVTRHGIIDMQVCVPSTFTDIDVLAFAERNNPCGTSNGWFIRKDGDKLLAGDPERVQCEDRQDCVHIMLDA